MMTINAAVTITGAGISPKTTGRIQDLAEFFGMPYTGTPPV